jgi:hypothetical protein
MGLTKHEALPFEVGVRRGICNLVVELNGDGSFSNVEILQVACGVIKSISFTERAVLVGGVTSLIGTANAMLINEVQDVVLRVRRRRLWGSNLYSGLLLAGGPPVTTLWAGIAHLPVLFAMLEFTHF